MHEILYDYLPTVVCYGLTYMHGLMYLHVLLVSVSYLTVIMLSVNAIHVCCYI